MKSFINYIRSSFDEVMNKVSWPKFGELQSTTILVLVAIVIFAGIVAAIDGVFKFAAESVYNL